MLKKTVDGDKGYHRFLEVLGNKVELKGFSDFAGGLDTRNNNTGTHSIYLKWRQFEIMYHVSTLLPFNPTDTQHVERKRYIGNGIYIFLEGLTSIVNTLII